LAHGERGSTIHTDGLASYSGAARTDYAHQRTSLKDRLAPTTCRPT
jgi:hypothetical protein